MKESGLLCIDNKSNSVGFINNDGSKASIAIGKFTSIKIEKLINPKGYTWRATLFGSNKAVVLETDITQKALVRWIQPVSDWLQIPVEFPDETIDGLLWTLTANRRVVPYPTKHSPDKSVTP